MNTTEKQILENLIRRAHSGQLETINATQCAISLFDVVFSRISKCDDTERSADIVLYGEEVAKAILQVTCRKRVDKKQKTE